jgi:subtilisin family serine protease
VSFARFYHVALLLLLVAATACTQPRAVRPALEQLEIPLDRQILVMVNEWPVRRYRPGSQFEPSYGSTSARPARVADDLAREYGLQLLNDWPMPALGVRCFLAAVPSLSGKEEIVTRLASDARVESVQSVRTFHTLAHNDAYYPLQRSAAALHLDDLHRLAQGRHVVIGEIDTGVEPEHPDLRGQLLDTVDLVDGNRHRGEWHGTAVAGIMAAKADNGVGIVGVAPEAKLLPLRACWPVAPSSADAVCSSFTLAKAIQYALMHSVRVLNLSLGGPEDPLLRRLVDKAIERRIVVVAALDPDGPLVSFPARAPGVIAVSAGEGLSVSSGVVYAPGERVLTTLPNGSWGFVSGHSFAAAHVSGMVALFLERAPQLKPADISALLQKQAEYSSASRQRTPVDACRALASLSGTASCECCASAATPNLQGVGDKGS